MEVMTNLDSVLKSKDIISPKRVHVFKDTAFPVIMYGCESWTIKKAECWRTDAFELWCWKRLSRVPWTGKRSNPSILKKINPKYSLEGLSWSWSSNTSVQRVDSLERLWCWEGLEAGGDGDDRGWDGWMASRLDGHEFEWTPGVGDGQGGLACCDSWGCKESDMTKQLNWRNGHD